MAEAARRRLSAVVARTVGLGSGSDEELAAMPSTDTWRMFDGWGRSRMVGLDGALGDPPVDDDGVRFS